MSLQTAARQKKIFTIMCLKAAALCAKIKYTDNVRCRAVDLRIDLAAKNLKYVFLRRKEIWQDRVADLTAAEAAEASAAVLEAVALAVAAVAALAAEAFTADPRIITIITTAVGDFSDRAITAAIMAADASAVCLA